MKTSFTLFLILFCCCTGSSQGIFNLSIDSSFQEYQDVDFTQSNLFYKFEAVMKNIGDSTMNIGWSVFDVQNCPSEWTLTSSDKYVDYILASNFDYAIPIDLLSEEAAPFNIVIYPREVEGCCSLKAQFFNADDPSEIYDTSYYQLKLNVENCTLTHTSEWIAENEIQIYPNLVTNYFQINAPVLFESGAIYNSHGNKVLDIGANENQITASKLSPGIYFLTLKLVSKEVLTVSFVKQV